MKKILLFILCVSFLNQVFGMENDSNWNKLPTEVKANILEYAAYDVPSLILNRQFKLLKEKLGNLRLVNQQINLIFDYLYDNKWINNLVDNINIIEKENPISKLALAQIFLNESQLEQFIQNNKIDLKNANQLGQQLFSEIICYNANGETHLDTIRKLIKDGADINFKAQYGDTALIWAANKGHANIVQILIAAGANLHLKEIDGKTALINASDKGHISIVEMLITAHANLNLKNSKGRTALMYAANGFTPNKEYANIVRKLIEAGANINLQDNEGLTALTIATNKRYNKIKKILKGDY